MKLRALLMLLPLTAAVQAQQPPQPPPVRSPEVTADGRVTFRVRAPNASKVTVFCECSTTEPARQRRRRRLERHGRPDRARHLYHFTVDGVDNLDQRNPVVSYNSRPNLIESVLDVPGPAPMFYDDQIGPAWHRQHQILSVEGDSTTRRAFVYTPPNYERSTGRLPVLYSCTAAMAMKPCGRSSAARI